MRSNKIKSKVLEIIQIRRSLRVYSNKKIETEKLALILEAARLAPSSCNSQPWHFVVVDDTELIRNLSFAVPVGTRINKFIKDAPLIIVCVSEPKTLIHKGMRLIDRDCSLIDIGIAVEHMVLVAAELGIGSCWIGWLSENKVKDLLSIPKKKSVIAMLALGYPKEKSNDQGIGGIKRRPRKKLDEITSKNKYGEVLKI